MPVVRTFVGKLNDDVVEILLWVASVVVGVVATIAHKLKGSELNPVYAGLIVGLLFRILTYVWRLGGAIKKTALTLEHVEDQVRFTNLKLTVHQLSGLLRITAAAILDRYRTTISPVSGRDGIQIAAENWVFAGNREFWSALIKEQQQRGPHRTAIEVKVTHSTAIDLWDRATEVHELLDLQQLFVGAGGKIRRIFVAREAEPTATHLRVMSMMNEKGIDVAYKPWGPSVDDDLDYDFTLVEEFRMVMKWYAGKIGGRVSRCELSRLSGRHDEVLDLWTRIDANARSLVDLDPAKSILFAGVHYAYYLTTKRGDPKGRAVMVKWDIRGLPTLHAAVSDETGAPAGRFVGDIDMIGEQVHVLLRRADGLERWHVIFKRSLNWEPEIYGAYAGTSADGDPVAGIILLRRQACSLEEASERLRGAEPLFATAPHR